ncbi:MAG: hypothetical protein AAF479_05915 [Pseudomonadota bacterium]
MSKSMMHNPSAQLGFAFCAPSADVAAGGSGDGVEVNSAWIAKGSSLGMAFAVPFTATLAEGETLSISGNLQDATDDAGAGAADFGTAVAATVVATGGTGGTTETGVALFDFDLGPARSHARLQFTPDLSAANTDTAEVHAVALIGTPTAKEETVAGLTRLN